MVYVDGPERTNMVQILGVGVRVRRQFLSRSKLYATLVEARSKIGKNIRSELTIFWSCMPPGGGIHFIRANVGHLGAVGALFWKCPRASKLMRESLEKKLSCSVERLCSYCEVQTDTSDISDILTSRKETS